MSAWNGVYTGKDPLDMAGRDEGDDVGPDAADYDYPYDDESEDCDWECPYSGRARSIQGGGDD